MTSPQQILCLVLNTVWKGLGGGTLLRVDEVCEGSDWSCQSEEGILLSTCWNFPRKVFTNEVALTSGQRDGHIWGTCWWMVVSWQGDHGLLVGWCECLNFGLEMQLQIGVYNLSGRGGAEGKENHFSWTAQMNLYFKVIVSGRHMWGCTFLTCGLECLIWRVPFAHY